MKKLVKNAIRCKHCGEILVSTYGHDFVQCKCGACFADGGLDYLRRGFRTSPDEDYEDLSEYADVPGYHVEYKNKKYSAFGGLEHEDDFPEELDRIYWRFPPEDYYLFITDEDGNIVFDNRKESIDA